MTLVEFIRIAAYIVIFGALWRLIEAHQSGTRLGAAMSFIY